VRRRCLLVAIWLVGGAVATSIGFGAVLLVGTEVTERSTATLSERAVLVELAARGTPGASTASRPGSTGTGTHPTPIIPLTAAATTAPRSPAPAASGSPAGSVPATPTGPAGSTGPASTLRSYQLTGGRVVLACAGPAMQLRYAVPADGYRSDVTASARQLKVVFQSSGQQSQLTATCRNGQPIVRVDDEREGD
jgi:hypothetical protein